MARFRPAILLLCVVASSAAGGPAETGMDDDDEIKYFPLQNHSFHGHLDFDNGLEHWLTSGATMALKDRVQLMPPVAHRHGLFWNRVPILTKNFVVNVTFNAKAAAGASRSDATFAMWLGPTDLSASYNEQEIVNDERPSWSSALEAAGFTLAGNKPDYSGVVVLFDATGEQSIIVAPLDGNASKPTLEDVKALKPKGAQRLDLKWVGGDMMLRVRVTSKGGVRIRVKPVGATSSGKAQFSLPAGTLLADQTFLGFTSWSGSTTAVELELKAMESRNYDLGRSGDGAHQDWQAMLEQEKRYLTQANQTDAVRGLTKLLQSFVNTCETSDRVLREGVSAVETRLSKLGDGFGELLLETKAFDFETGAFDPTVVMQHLKGVGSILRAGKVKHDSKMSAVHEVARALKTSADGHAAKKAKAHTISRQATALEAHSAAGSFQSGGLLLFLVVIVAGFVVMFFKRMRYYEKKHYV